MKVVQKKDLIGNELKVGDHVAHISVRYGTSMIEGGPSIVIGIKQDKIQILNYTYCGDRDDEMEITEVRKSSVLPHRVIKTIPQDYLVKAVRRYEQRNNKKKVLV